MIQCLNYVISESTNPCVNLAMEERLLDTVQDGEATVYLWQNERTVVIGKNQNACAECNLTALREDGGHLVRRLSGGGAVYHPHDGTFVLSSGSDGFRHRDRDIYRPLCAAGFPARAAGGFSQQVTCMFQNEHLREEFD